LAIGFLCDVSSAPSYTKDRAKGEKFPFFFQEITMGLLIELARGGIETMGPRKAGAKRNS
jgi:hypothetical protein